MKNQTTGRVVQLLALGFRSCRVKYLKLAWSGWRVLQARTYPPLDLGGKGRVLDTAVLFSALIGFGSQVQPGAVGHTR